MMRFVKGESYWAIPCLEGAPRKVVTVAGRGSGGIIFSQPSETVPQTEWSREIEGRETARVMLPDGAYTVSASLQLSCNTHPSFCGRSDNTRLH